MDEPVYRRLCMTSVCGAILIPVAMALVSAHSTRQHADSAFASALTPSTAAAGAIRPGAIEVRDDAAQPSPSDRTTP